MSAHSSPFARVAFSGILATFLAIAAWFLGGISPQVAGAQIDSCPNAAIRSQQNATHLPDCRAYEQVSPVNKNGNHIGISRQDEVTGGLALGPVISTTDGGTAFFTSSGAFADADSAVLLNTYASHADTTDWRTQSLDPPVVPTALINFWGLIGATPDFSKTFIVSDEELAPGGNRFKFNMYIHDETTDSYDLVATNPTRTLTQVFSIPKAFMAVGSPDGSRWFFTQPRYHVDSTPAPANPTSAADVNLYEYADGEVRLAGVLPNGDASPFGSTPGDADSGPGGGGNYPHAMWVARRAISADVKQVYWSDPAIYQNPDNDPIGAPSPIFLYRDGASKLITRRETDDSPQEGKFWFANLDGSSAFVTSDAQLTSDASPTGFDLYRYDRDEEGGDGGLVNLTPTGTSAEVEGVMGTSEDGSRVYFQATGGLAPGANAGDHNIYVWSEDGIRFLGATESTFPGFAERSTDAWRVSPDGSNFGFITGDSISGPDPHPGTGGRQVYLYDYADDELSCASCPTGTPVGDAKFQMPTGAGSALQAFNQGYTHNVLDDGRVFFQSPDALLPQDTNGAVDVYQYQDGILDLISDGKNAADSYFGDASPNGSDVFLLTQAQLVGQDEDQLIDLYDAKVAGGMQAQAPIEQPDCQGDACQGEPTSPPADTAPSSSEIIGGGNAPPGSDCRSLERRVDKRKARASKAKQKARRTKRKAKQASGSKAKRLQQRATKQKRKAKQATKRARSVKRELSGCRSSR